MDKNFNNFATYDPLSMSFSSLIPKDSMGKFTGIVLGFNVGLALAIYLLVRVQLWMYFKQIEVDAKYPRPEGKS